MGVFYFRRIIENSIIFNIPYLQDTLDSDIMFLCILVSERNEVSSVDDFSNSSNQPAFLSNFLVKNVPILLGFFAW